MLRITHYKLDVQLRLEPESMPRTAPGQIHVDAALRVENAGQEPVTSLPLLLYRLYTVRDVRVNGQKARTTSRIARMKGRERWHVNAVKVALPEPLAPGASCEVALRYGGVTAGAREVWQYLWDNVSRAYTLLRPDIKWYPVAAEPEMHLLQRVAREEAHYDVTVRAPEGFVAVGPGRAEQGEGAVRFVTPKPRTRFDLAVAPFEVHRAGNISVYYTPQWAEWGRAAAGWVEAALRGMERRLGPREAGHLAVVQIPPGWGSQSSDGYVLQEPGAADDWFSAAQVVHEVAHFWTPGPIDHPIRFADESLATYFEALLVGDLFGPERMQQRLGQLRRAVERTPEALETNLLHPVPDRLHGVVWYAKGALALHDLHNRLGDENFWGLLREYTAEPASVEEFVSLLQRRYAGPETQHYLDLWFR